MVNLERDICFKIREARRAAGLSQTVLAKEIGCKQSALSMFEKGDGTKLNEEAVTRLCAKFNIELPKDHSPSETGGTVPARSMVFSASRGFCPNAECPSHHRYFVESRTLLQPDRSRQDPVGGTFCAVCGEVLEHACPTCGAPVHDGAICSFCGKPYVFCN